MKATVADLRGKDGTRACADQKKADELNDFFQSVFRREDTTNMSSAHLYEVGSRLDDVEIINEKAKKNLSNLCSSKSPGPDSIRPLILNHMADGLSNHTNLSVVD